jgi:hypothetical protein
VLNVVEDQRLETREWLPDFARRLDAPAPKRVPTVIAKFAVGGWGAAFMTQLRGATNHKAPTTLDWKPAHRF